jgi:hypothetical protein
MIGRIIEEINKCIAASHHWDPLVRPCLEYLYEKAEEEARSGGYASEQTRRLAPETSPSDRPTLDGCDKADPDEGSA